MIERRFCRCVVLLLSSWAVTVTMESVAAQSNRRGYSSRGVNPAASRAQSLRGPSITGAARPGYNTRFGGNLGGPLGFSSGYYYGLPSPNYYSGDYSQSDMGAQGESGTAGEPSASGTRPNIRPRLDLTDRDAINSNRVLQSIRQRVLEQIAACTQKPFSTAWHTAHPNVPPVVTAKGDRWLRTDWGLASRLVGVDAEPFVYDFQPDKVGLIFVQRNGVPQELAVEARGPAVRLAETTQSLKDVSGAVSLGVFAAIPPADHPVTSLLQIAIHQSGTVTGYQYDFATDSAQPLQGAVDKSTQRVAWRVGDNYAEAGLKNLTDDVARFLLFRDDGWTQPWILMRVPQS